MFRIYIIHIFITIFIANAALSLNNNKQKYDQMARIICKQEFLPCENDIFIFQDLLIEYDINYKEPLMGCSLLAVAVEEGRILYAKKLIELGANINIAMSFGDTPLHLAATKGDAEMANLLLENGADINLKTKDGTTPIMIAILANFWDFIKEIIKNNKVKEYYLKDLENLKNFAEKYHTQWQEIL